MSGKKRKLAQASKSVKKRNAGTQPQTVVSDPSLTVSDSIVEKAKG